LGKRIENSTVTGKKSNIGIGIKDDFFS